MWLGPPGKILEIVDPDQNLPIKRDIIRSEHRLLNGNRVVDHFHRPSRGWQLSWNILTKAEYTVLQELHEGMWGAFPFVFFDMNVPNILTSAQSTGGSTGIPSGTSSLGVFWGLDGGFAGASTSPAVPGLVGTHYCLYLSPTTAFANEAGVALGDDSDPLETRKTGNATPVKASQQYTFQCMIRHISGGTVSWRAAIAFYKADGEQTGTTTFGAGANITSSWVARSVTATAPADAAYAICSVRNTNALAAASNFAIDAMSLHEGASTITWEMGGGAPFVGPFNIEDMYPWLPYHGPVRVELLEVA